MSDSGARRAREPDDRGAPITTVASGYDEYAAARERYFERLRVDSEIRRLERAWAEGPGTSPPPTGSTRAAPAR